MTALFDAAGRRRLPATMPGYHSGRPPRNKGLRYPADPAHCGGDRAVARGPAHSRGARARPA
jgi:hypothetical protein